LPRGKALRATEENRNRFESMKSELAERSLALKGEAGQVAATLDGKSFTVLARLRRPASCSARCHRAIS
jgi:large subunit ribosomal protein L9